MCMYLFEKTVIDSVPFNLQNSKFRFAIIYVYISNFDDEYYHKPVRRLSNSSKNMTTKNRRLTDEENEV